jgi:hypothetical protein
MSLLDAVFMLAMAWKWDHKETNASSFRKAGFITSAVPAEQAEDGDDEVSCGVWYNFQEKLNTRFTFDAFVQADNTLPPCGELDVVQLCDHVSSNPDETEMGGQVAYDCQSVPTSSEGI